MNNPCPQVKTIHIPSGTHEIRLTSDQEFYLWKVAKPMYEHIVRETKKQERR